MSNSGQLKTDLGEQLYQLLPSVYREQDNSTRHSDNSIDQKGDLAKYLDANGELLNRIYYTIKQQLYDNFADEAGPDSEGIEQSCQPWLLPYFADLLDVELVSPDTNGQRAEVANAIAWRQSKGTLPCLEAICEAVGQFEVQVQEGFKRVATTARIGDPLLPAVLFGADESLDEATQASLKARHPGLPYVTVDLRYASRAVQCDPNDPAAIECNKNYSKGNEVDSDAESHLEERHWCQKNHSGTPCFPNSYQDVSKRTVDFRLSQRTNHSTNQATVTPKGQYHPRKLLCFMPMQTGLFSHEPKRFTSANFESAVNALAFGESYHYPDVDAPDISISRVDNDSDIAHFVVKGLTEKPLKITGVLELAQPMILECENLWFDNRLQLNNGTLILNRCAARKVILNKNQQETFLLKAVSSVIKSVEMARGRLELEYCTVLADILAEVVLITDCILLGSLTKDRDSDEEPSQGCIRYTRCDYDEDEEDEEDAEAAITLPLNLASCTTAQPLFFSNTFGSVGCGVLQPGCDDKIKYGAEDGSEMGAYHNQRMVLKLDAIIDKLDDFLPVGMEAVLIYDDSLSCLPPSQK